ncbi:MAG TPA: Gfo/Idh/MocA family oxidoreductase [Streptosporangiaceae bacterium]|nr:Gfo/Idh/MocA family oxidoreductase [Streptosporangiaceae bacterium]
MTSESPLRFGLVGTGYWARVTHAPALASTGGIELAAVWGRDARKAGSLAAEHGAAACTDFGEFLGRVDAVAFSVPPDVQQELAVRAARAGKHLLLEKPIALSVAAADELAGAVAAAGVASVVFFTQRFEPGVREWLARVAAGGPWLGGTLTWLGTAMDESSPFNTPWRRDKGGLWDLGPHAVSLLWASLGPVVSVTADAGPRGVTYLILHHESGVTSSVTVTLDAPPAAEALDLRLWGEPGRSAAPLADRDVVAALRTALTELAASARSGYPSHPCDARFGRDIVAILAEAERQVAS